jgi:hypothetical protein
LRGVSSGCADLEDRPEVVYTTSPVDWAHVCSDDGSGPQTAPCTKVGPVLSLPSVLARLSRRTLRVYDQRSRLHIDNVQPWRTLPPAAAQRCTRAPSRNRRRSIAAAATAGYFPHALWCPLLDSLSVDSSMDLEWRRAACGVSYVSRRHCGRSILIPMQQMRRPAAGGL